MRNPSRRGFLTSAAAVAAASVAGGLVGSAVSQGATEASQGPSVLATSVGFHGVHQSGIMLEPQAFTNFIGLSLLESTNSAAMLRWMKLLTDDIRRLMAGEQTLADAQPELILGPARLTVNIGLGPSLFKKLGLEDQRPVSLEDLPSFSMDKLADEFSGGGCPTPRLRR